MILFDNCRFLITTPNPDGVIEGGWVLVDGPTIHSVGRARGFAEGRPVGTRCRGCGLQRQAGDARDDR